MHDINVFKSFGYAGNGEAYQVPTSTRPLGITRSVPGLCGYQAKDYSLPIPPLLYAESIKLSVRLNELLIMGIGLED